MKLLKTIELECGHTYLTKLEDGNILEMGDVFMSVEKGWEQDLISLRILKSHQIPIKEL